MLYSSIPDNYQLNRIKTSLVIKKLSIKQNKQVTLSLESEKMPYQKINCWLFSQLPTQALGFFNGDGAGERFEKWTKQMPKLGLNQLRVDYLDFLVTNDIFYKGNFLEIEDPSIKKIREDLIRTFGVLRTNFGGSSEISRDDYDNYCAMLRMVMYLHKTGEYYRYRQTLIDLICPIYHVAWYGLMVNGVTDTYTIEAEALHMFMNFMEMSQFREIFPGSPSFTPQIQDDIISMIKREIQDINSDIFSHINICNEVFLPILRWYLLIFTQSIPMGKNLYIWDYLLGSDLFNFPTTLAYACALVVCFLFELGHFKETKGDPMKIIELLQNLSQDHKTVNNIVDKIRAAPYKKQGLKLDWIFSFS